MRKTSASQSQQPASPAMEDVPDRTAALARIGGAARLLAEMAGVLLQDCPKQLSAVCAAGAHHDSTLVERAAHKLEGSLGMLGAKEAKPSKLPSGLKRWSAQAISPDLKRFSGSSTEPSNASTLCRRVCWSGGR